MYVKPSAFTLALRWGVLVSNEGGRALLATVTAVYIILQQLTCLCPALDTAHLLITLEYLEVVQCPFLFHGTAGHALQRRASTFVQKGTHLFNVGSSDLARHLVPELPEHRAPNLVRDLQLIAVRSGRSGLVCEVVINYFRRIRLRSFAWEPTRGVEAGAGTGARREAGGELGERWICDTANPENLNRCSLSSAGDSSALP